eukprot:TRINITY_DN42218_c0_g1_i1.p1 TRINITY_DN42218_c0_g1~~TRINITY_DN42218_c0_g1_i1.p1  ORF type:complete len:787 (-),score=75.42 TRINITY_DN42218_c0_g1_i1:153-2513(-)
MEETLQTQTRDDPLPNRLADVELLGGVVSDDEGKDLQHSIHNELATMVTDLSSSMENLFRSRREACQCGQYFSSGESSCPSCNASTLDKMTCRCKQSSQQCPCKFCTASIERDRPETNKMQYPMPFNDFGFSFEDASRKAALAVIPWADQKQDQEETKATSVPPSPAVSSKLTQSNSQSTLSTGRARMSQVSSDAVPSSSTYREAMSSLSDFPLKEALRPSLRFSEKNGLPCASRSKSVALLLAQGESPLFELVALGGAVGSKRLNLMESFSSSRGWKPSPPMPTNRRSFCVGICGQRLFAIGGYGGGGTMDSMDVFDFKMRSWSIGPPMSTARSLFGLTSIGPLFYAVGGYGVSHLRSVEVFDVGVFVWSHAPSLPSGRSALCAVTVHDRVVAIGGNPDTRKVEFLDLSTGTWIVGPLLRNGRSQFGVCTLHGHIFCVGGLGQSCDLSSVEVLRQGANEWEEVRHMPTPRCSLGVTAINNTMVVIGGRRGSTPVAAVEMYDPDSDEWFHGVPLPVARHGLAVAAFVDGELSCSKCTRSFRVSRPSSQLTLKSRKSKAESKEEDETIRPLTPRLSGSTREVTQKNAGDPAAPSWQRDSVQARRSLSLGPSNRPTRSSKSSKSDSVHDPNQHTRCIMRIQELESMLRCQQDHILHLEKTLVERDSTIEKFQSGEQTNHQAVETRKFSSGTPMNRPGVDSTRKLHWEDPRKPQAVEPEMLQLEEPTRHLAVEAEDLQPEEPKRQQAVEEQTLGDPTSTPTETGAVEAETSEYAEDPAPARGIDLEDAF